MNRKPIRRLIQSLAPEGIVVLVAVILVTWESTLVPLATFARFSAYAVFGAGILLSWRFHRGRALFSLLVLALGAWAASSALAAASVASDPLRVTFEAAAFLVPLNLAALTLIPERGVLTAAGLVRLTIIGLQAGGVILLAYPEPAAVAELLRVVVLPRSLVTWSHIGDPTLLVFFGSFAIAGAGFAVKRDRAGSSMIWTLVATFLAFQTTSSAAAVTFYFAAAGLVMVVGVIETSYRMAYRDALTALPARRALNEALDQIDGDYTVAMVDVDRFKKFNDEHGHDVGDQVLRMVADHLKSVDGGGRAYRYGGEEFAILFPGKTRDECQHHLEQVRNIVADTAFAVRGPGRPPKKPQARAARKRATKHLSVTVSIGLAERSDRRNTADKVIKAADQALYRAKKSGRNRVSR